MIFFLNFLTFILFSLLAYMFFRLLAVLYKKGILESIDVFYVTSNPWEFKKHKNELDKEKRNDT